ncbi:hypothetical protein E4U48_005459 [Claviceps purpurea]|nr:hypothetical protein E4U48_005459 [Claviceps purpurea]
MTSTPPPAVDAVTTHDTALPAPAAAPTASSPASVSASAWTRAPATGTKRPAPSLLPAFEPLSSPVLPRPLKRQNRGQAHLQYPTPVPTSATGVLSSSPPPPGLDCVASGRAPLSAVPAVELPEDGRVVTMGRSSNSSQLQLSANRLVSRVHVKARYISAASPLEVNKIEIECYGWNGLKLHCRGRTWELCKGDIFSSETEGTEHIVDVLGARVMIQWPKRSTVAAESLANLSDSSWDDSPPRSHQRDHALLSSPLRRTTRIKSPESPTPRGLVSSQRLQALLPNTSEVREDGIQIYEDEPELPLPKRDDDAAVDAGASMMTNVTASFSSELGDEDDENEHHAEEENDPILHSFGPFGPSISHRLGSVFTKMPKQPRPQHRQPHHVSSNDTLSAADLSPMPSSPIKKSFANPSPRALLPAATIKESRQYVPSSPAASTPTAEVSHQETAEAVKKEDKPTPSIEVAPAVTNHVINQLAFSRLASTPLSSIMQNLPDVYKAEVSKDVLRATIEATPCIGIIPRQGKDAAGKALDSEYYYQPDQDYDLERRRVVDSARKPSLRNCRKQHKQYYWKRPKTP